MEREFLNVLDWKLVITEAEVIAHHYLSVLASVHHLPPKKTSNSSLSPSFLPSLATMNMTTITTTSSIPRAWDTTSTPKRRLTTGGELSGPGPLYTQPFQR